jgi:two-component system, OmpR family, sensor histidine kinase KdpD
MIPIGNRQGSNAQPAANAQSRLLVAVGNGPNSGQLIRWTNRMATAQNAPWMAVHVTGKTRLKPELQSQLEKNLTLARKLGAEIVTLFDEDIAAALVRTAQEYNATQIVVGKPTGNRWLRTIRGGGIVEEILRRSERIDVFVVPAQPGTQRSSRLEFESTYEGTFGEFAIALATIGGITAAATLVPTRYYIATGLVYLLGVILLSLRVGRWPMLAAGILSSLIWNYFFVPHRYSLRVGGVEDGIMLVTYYVVAIVAGQLTARVRAQSREEHNREQRATALFELTHTLAQAQSVDAALSGALRQIDSLFSARSILFYYDEPENDLRAYPAATYQPSINERSGILQVCKTRSPAGRFTDTLGHYAGMYLPLVCGRNCLGVLGISVGKNASLSLEQRDLLDAFAQQLAVVIEHDLLRAAGERERMLAESEKLYHALLDSVSHELRTPLSVIKGNIDNIAKTDDPNERAALAEELRIAVRRLNRLVDNLLGQTRLESGSLKPHMDWCDPVDIVNDALANVRDAFDKHPLTLALPGTLPPVRADHALIERALANLLLNAAMHTPENTPVEVGAYVTEDGSRMIFFVADRGSGIPDALKEKIFAKFSREKTTHTGGLGLGLSIVRGFVRAQGGTVAVKDNPIGGSIFTITLALDKIDPQVP